MQAKLKNAAGITIATLVVLVFVSFVAATVMNVYNQPGRAQAEQNQRETNDILAGGHQKTPYVDIKTPASVTVVARGMNFPYTIQSPDVQSRSNCTVFPSGAFSRVGDILVGKRILVSYDKTADDGPSDECAAGSLFLWGPINQPGLGSAVGITPGSK